MSFLGCARIGARRSGADPSNAPFLAHLAEELCKVLTPEFIRERFEVALSSGKHPSWFEGEIDVVEWHSFLLRQFEQWGRRPNDKGRTVWLVAKQRREPVPCDLADPRFAALPANDARATS